MLLRIYDANLDVFIIDKLKVDDICEIRGNLIDFLRSG